MSPSPPDIIIGIPGEWASRTDLVREIANRSDGYIAGGLVLMDTKSSAAFTLDVQDSDPALANAFRIAGEGRLDSSVLSRIAQHRLVVYLLALGGSVAAARNAARAACAILDAGGIAVKIESTGKAHTGSAWREVAKSTDLFMLYSAYVVLVGDTGFSYSCGMHNFGLPDAGVPSFLGPEGGAQLLNSFLFYLLSEAPRIESGHTFQASPSEPLYRLTLVGADMYPDEDPFHNPYGLWRMEPAGTA
jgi:hypothetical protein